MPTRIRALVVSICAGAALFTNSLLLAQPAPEGASGWRDRKPVVARQFMIAAANPLAVDAGHAMLARGGSAVDAAIAAQLVLGLVEPQSSGIGGGGFMLVHDAASRKLLAYDGRETAPAAAKPDRFLDRDGKPLRFIDAVVGGRSVGVPGTVALLAAAHRAHGRLRWADLFAPAIALAEQGFAVSPRLATSIAGMEGPAGNDRARQYFARAGGGPLQAGDTLAQPGYARTLRTLATPGRRGVLPRRARARCRCPRRTCRRERRRSDARRSRRLPREDAHAGVRTVSRLSRLRHAASVVGRTDGAADARDARALQPRRRWARRRSGARISSRRRGGSLTPTAVRSWPIRTSWLRRRGLLDPDYLRQRGAQIRATASLGRATPGDAAGDREGSDASARIARRHRAACDIASVDRRWQGQRGRRSRRRSRTRSAAG